MTDDMQGIERAGMTSQSGTGPQAPLDQIRLVGIGGVGRHGVLPEERQDGQTFLVDVALGVDTRAAAASDDLNATVNYAEVAREVIAHIEGEPVNLIETLAARIADAVLAHDGVRTVEVTVHKPEAPVGVPFTDVQVTIRRPIAAPAPLAGGVADGGAAEMPAAPPVEPHLDPPTARRPEPDLDEAPDQPVPVVLALGGNVGDVRGTLRSAVAELQEADGLTVEEISPLARTAAVLQPDAVTQPDYLNAVVLATTTLSPRELLALTQDLESTHGRQRAERWGERTLDVDIIVYGGITSSDAELTLPHPRANERAFVLVPWAQADPDAFLPGLGGGPVATLAETAPDRSGVRWLALDWLEEPTPAMRAPAVEPAPVAAPDPAPEPEPEPEPEQPSAPQPPPAPLPAQAAAPAPAAVDPEAAPPAADDVDRAPWNEPSGEDVNDLELLAHGDETEADAAEEEDEPAADALDWVPRAPAEAPPIAPRWQPLHRDD